MHIAARIVGLGLLLVLQMHGPAGAQTFLGSKATGSLLAGDRVIPLLDGEWTVVATTSTRASTQGRPLMRAILAQMQGGRLARWAIIDTNLEPNVGNGWTRDKVICDRKDVHFGYSDSNYNVRDASCWALNHYGETLGSSPSQVSVDFYRWSDSLGRPNTSLALAYYFAKRGDFLRVIYHFNPVLAGFPDTPTASWRGNPWHVDIASKDPKKLAYLRSLKAIGEKQFVDLQAVLK